MNLRSLNIKTGKSITSVQDNDSHIQVCNECENDIVICDVDNVTLESSDVSKNNGINECNKNTIICDVDSV